LPVLLRRFFAGSNLVLRNPDNARELHDMRLEGKRLRFAMEAFAPAFGKAFARSLKEIRDILRLMGLIHDCDVSIGILADFLREFEIFNSMQSADEPALALRPLRELLSGQRALRLELFARLRAALKQREISALRKRFEKALDSK
jgi:CHAD domain-containing protein